MREPLWARSRRNIEGFPNPHTRVMARIRSGNLAMAVTGGGEEKLLLLAQELAGLLQGHIDVGADVVGIHLVIEMCLLQLAVYLRRYSG